MLDLVREGGFPMFIILALGIWALVSAVLAWRHATRSRIAAAQSLRSAVVYATLVGMFADLAAVGHHAPQFEQPTFDLAHIVVQGFAESMSPGIMGFAFAAIATVFVALAERRSVD